jgi:formate dehydrogenase gamma subunit
MEETRPIKASQNITEGKPSLRTERLPTLQGHRVKPKTASKQKRAPRMTVREAHDAASRLVVNERGQRLILRFSLSQRIEHQLLIISFTMLAITGVPQRYVNTPLGSGLLQIMGGIDLARQLHHLFALVFLLEVVYHVGAYMYNLAVYKRIGGIWPAWSDAIHLSQMLRLNLGLSNKHPKFGRFSFEEKVEYWALVWGSVLMIVTGIIQWFPTLVTRWLPGVSIPFARTLHSWEAILAVLSILTWHLYHTVIKHFNKSIFTGYMTEEEMREEHPGELEYIERAAVSAARMNQSAMMRGEISKKSNGRERVISGNEPMDISLAKENRTGDPNP